MPAVAPAADLDDGPRTARSGVVRMCALTRRVEPVEALIRFVVGPDGAVVPDLRRRLPGRGLWLTASKAVVGQALRKGIFARGFRRKVAASPTFADEVEALLVAGVQDALAMAAKAGQVVAGFAKVERAIAERRAVALIHATDGAADGRRKLEAAARQTYIGADGGLPVIDALSSAQLDLALGRSNVIHAALTAGPANGSVLSRCQILVRYRTETGDAPDAGAMLDGDETDGSMARSRAVEHD
ncbi:MAG: RNA-binding protein [Xanthobacteraceae bacterium]